MISALLLTLLWHSFRLNPQLEAAVTDRSAPQRTHWRVNTGGNISASPTYAQGTVYASSNSGTLFAIDYKTGAVRWRFTANNKLMSAPLVDGGIVIVSSGDQETRVWDPPHYVVLGSGASTIYGIDRRSGRERWHLNIIGTGMPTGVIAANTYLHVDGSGLLIALDPETGRMRWRENVGSSSAMSEPVDMGDGTILLSGGFPNAVYRIRAGNGQIVWRHRFPDCAAAFTDQPVASDGKRVYGAYLKLQTNDPRCFGVFASGVQHAYALDAHNGRLLWDRVLSTGSVPPRNEGAIPLVHDGVVYMGSSVAPEMRALESATGRVLWKRRVHGAVKAGSVIVNRVLYFGDLGGTLWALDDRSGAVRGAVREPLRFNVGSPIAVNRTLIIGSKQGELLAVPLDQIR